MGFNEKKTAIYNREITSDFFFFSLKIEKKQKLDPAELLIDMEKKTAKCLCI